MSEPDHIVAGDTVAWLRELPEYPASDGWSLEYYFRGQAGSFQVTATAEGDAHRVEVAPGTSAGWAPGTYVWQAFATKTGARHRVDSGELVVEIDFTQVSGAYDPRSHAEKMVEAIEALMERRATTDQQSYKLPDGRELQRLGLADLNAWHKRYRQIVANEKRSKRLKDGGQLTGMIQVRFTR